MNIVIGISGSIAAYKSINLASLFVKKGYDVKTILTNNAQKFIRPIVLETLTGHKPICDQFSENINPLEHIYLADWADIVIIAPASANIIGKIANGLADDFLSTFLLACDKEIFIAPAMNTKMYHNDFVQNNLKKIKEYGLNILLPNSGTLACGVIGEGKMQEPMEILENVLNHSEINIINKSLSGKKILITAGPTIERFDPVRYITNNSSGKMGYYLAEVAKSFGAEVTLISGPVNLLPPSGINTIYIESTEDLFKKTKELYKEYDIIIMSAAPADYRPEKYSINKIKKSNEELTISFKKNPDILKWLGDHKTTQILIGFAAESENILNNAQKKLISKNLDYIIANDISLVDSGFKSEYNTIHILSKNGTVESLKKLPKTEISKIILSKLI